MSGPSSGGGFAAIKYTLKKANEAGGWWAMYKALATNNACKTCALGMGGQKGGMTNESGSWPEVCKKSVQAMAADMQPAIEECFWKERPLTKLAQMTPRELEMSGRLVDPVIYRRGEAGYQPISWEEALGKIAAKLKSLSPAETFWYFSGRSSNEAGFLLQLFARLYGTNNVNNCSYYCHQASGVGLTSSVGSGTATLMLEDLEHSDLVWIIGGNPPSNHPRIMTSLMHVRRAGGDVIVVNPVIETGLVNFHVPSNMRSLLLGGDKIATQYVQPHIGGDLAMLTGVAKQIDEMGAADIPFLEEHCENWPAWRDSLRATSWEEIETKSGVDRETIIAMAEKYAKSKKAVFTWTMGITHHAHGVDNVQAIANLALMRGMVGKPHTGLMPIRGHSNVQGIGSVGVTPKLKEAIFDRLVSEYGVTLPTDAGLDTLACMDGAYNKELKFGLCLGGNLYGSNPDSHYADESMSRLEMLVHMSTTLNTGHAHGLADETIILPVLARDEEPQATTQESMFNFVRLSDGGPRRHQGPKSEIEIVANMGGQVLGDSTPIDWQSMEDNRNIRAMIAKVIPGYQAIGKIDDSKSEFQIDGRTFHQPKFGTANGKAVLHTHTLPDLKGEEKELRLMTVRSEGQFNTVVYEEDDYYRGQTRRDVILLHPDDISRLGLTAHQKATVRSSTGSMPHILVQPFDRIRAGNALMYYPESNVLVSRAIDQKSRTPAFKGVIITIEPE